MALQHLRSSTANKRPTPGAMSDGQLALNTNLASPGLFFKDSNGDSIKVGPVHVGTTAPNATPGAGGQAGNSKGEQWLDTSSSRYVFKIWDGTAWRTEDGEFVNVSGDLMTGALGIIAGAAATPGLYFSGDTNTGIYSPAADTLAFVEGGVEAMRIDSSGRLLRGNTASINTVNLAGSTITPAVQQHAVDQGNATFAATNWQASSTAAYLVLGKSYGAAVGTHAPVASNALIGTVNFAASDGTTFGSAAHISAVADALTSAGSTPGRLTFHTSAPGSTSPTERMRIRSDGNIGIGGAGSPTVTLYNQGTITGGVTAYGNFTVATVQSDVTSAAYGYVTQLTTTAATFTVGSLQHFLATGPAKGAGSTITQQIGFHANANLTQATENYGFYGNIPDATGRWNFYAAGTADSYFASNNFIWANGGTERARIDSSGRLLVGTSTTRAVGGAGNASAQIEGTTVATSSLSLATNSANTNGPRITFGKSRGVTTGSTDAVLNGDELTLLEFNGADGTDLNNPAASISCAADGTIATNSVPGRLVFSTTADGASTPTPRMRIRSDGNIAIGGAGSPTVTLYNQGAITGGVTAYGNFTVATVQSDVTSAAYGYVTQLTTTAATFTVGSLQHFLATGPAKGAGSTITQQIGFHANANLTQATENYGFYGSIPDATGRWNFYAAGTAPNYFAGDVRSNTVVTKRQTPSGSNTSVTLTAASIIDGLRTGTPAAGINYTLPTGTNMDAAFQELQNNQSFEWSVLNLAGATHAITVLTNTGHTVEGNMVVAANSSGRFLTRKATTNTFTTYRIA